jgi:hypothetical protein
MPEQFTITCALLQVTNLVHIHYLKAARVMGLHQIQKLLRQKSDSPDGQKEISNNCHLQQGKGGEMGIFQFGLASFRLQVRRSR